MATVVTRANAEQDFIETVKSVGKIIKYDLTTLSFFNRKCRGKPSLMTSGNDNCVIHKLAVDGILVHVFLKVNHMSLMYCKI